MRAGDEMNILIFEDDQNDLINLLDCINNFFSETEIEYNIDTCTEDSYILANHFNYDIVFLDIEVNDKNGIDIGCKIRKENQDIRIIFITNFSKYLIDGYKAQANRYFIKPIQQEDFDLEFRNVISDYLEKYNGFFDETISVGKIYFNEILYIEYLDRKTNIYFQSGKILETSYPLKYWINFLQENEFAQPYKSIIVNLKHISGFTKNEVILSNEERLPISRFFKNEFEMKYMKCLHRRI